MTGCTGPRRRGGHAHANSAIIAALGETCGLGFGALLPLPALQIPEQFVDRGDDLRVVLLCVADHAVLVEDVGGRPASERCRGRQTGSVTVPPQTAPSASSVARRPRLDRALLTGFESDIEMIVAHLDATNFDAAVALARLPGTIKGFGPVKEDAAESARVRRNLYLAQLHTPPEMARPYRCSGEPAGKAVA